MEAPEEVAPRVPGLVADMAGRFAPLQRRAMDGGALEALADLVQLPAAESCDELLVRVCRAEAAITSDDGWGYAPGLRQRPGH